MFIQISEAQVGRAIRTKRWKYSVSAPELDGWSTPGSDHYVEEYLYDLDADPYELQNILGRDAYADVTAELRKRLIAEMVKAGEAEPTITPAEPRKSGQRGLSLQAVRDRYLGFKVPSDQEAPR